MAKQTKQTTPVYYKMTGTSLYGKFATILLTDTALEFHTTSTFLFILTAWLFACAGFVIGVFTGVYILFFFLPILCGIMGAVLVWKCYVGKLKERYAYNDITSFVLSGADCTINTKDNKMYTIRMLPKRQYKLMDALRGILEAQTPFFLQQDGNYYRIKSKKDAKPHQGA